MTILFNESIISNLYMPSVNFGTHKLDMINLTLEIDILLNFSKAKVE